MLAVSIIASPQLVCFVSSTFRTFYKKSRPLFKKVCKNRMFSWNYQTIFLKTLKFIF